MPRLGESWQQQQQQHPRDGSSFDPTQMMQISGASGANAQNYCQIAISFPCPILFFYPKPSIFILSLPPVAHSLKQVLNLSCYLFICFVLKCKLELWLTKLASVTPSYITLFTTLFEDQQARDGITLLNMGDAIVSW